MDRLTGHHGSTYHGTSRNGVPVRGKRNRSPMRDHPELVTLDETEDRVDGSTHARGVAGDDVQYRLELGRRARNGAQDLARRRLLLQRLGQFTVSGLQFLGQAGVFDRDRGLGGKGLEERDLPGGERTDGRPPDGDRAHGRAVANQGGHEIGADAGRLLRLGGCGELGLDGLRQIADLDRPSVQHGTACDGVPAERVVHTPNGDGRPEGSMPGDEPQPFAIKPQDERVVRVAELRCGAGDRTQHKLHPIPRTTVGPRDPPAGFPLCRAFRGTDLPHDTPPMESRPSPCPFSILLFPSLPLPLDAMSLS